MRNLKNPFLIAAAAFFISIPGGTAGPVPSAGLGGSFFSQMRGIEAHMAARFKEVLEEDRALRAVLHHLEGSAVPRAYVEAAFDHQGVRVEQDIIDRFNRPAERLDYERYRRIFITPKRIEAGRRFYAENRELLMDLAGRYGVDPLLLVSIPGVETFFGRYGGKHTVFNALYTAVHGVPKRAAWAARELAEFLKYTHADGLPPHSILGSYAGAFGYFQFIPSSFNAYAVDYDGDGVRRPDVWPDVLASIANYFVENGYRPGETDYSRAGSIWRAIYAYNHSDNYVKVVLELRSEIAKGLPQG